MLEKQLLVLNDFPKKVTETYRLGLSSAIRRCYLDMGEQDVWLTLKTKACTSSLLKYAVSVDMYGRVQEALQRFEFLLEQSENTHLNEAFVPSDSEITLLEDRWIAIHKETCQLTSLSKFSELSGFSKLLMECAWKNRDWEKLRLLCSSPAAISALELGDIDVKMNEIFLAIYDEKLHDIENLHAQTAQLCLYKWQLLPSVFSGCNAHLTLLRYFNRLVDVRESGQVMVEARYVLRRFHLLNCRRRLINYCTWKLLQSQHTNGKSYPDLKNLLNAWRNRLPNHYEPLSVWDDVFQWRSYMFSAISKKFQWTEQSTLASLHDRPWTTIRMAGAARQQDVIGVSLLSLSKLTDCAMDVNDAFSKLNEQILSYRHGSEDEKKGGLNLINTTNLSYFDSLQKSELFRLKAEFLESLGGKTKATQAYCHAVQLCPTYARAWISWGNLCWSLADLVETQGRKQINSSSAEDKDKKAANAKKVCQYLAQSMGCYLEAVRCDASEDSRINLPRCLIMLAKDGPCPGLLCTTFEKYATTLPSWIWLPWIPQLLSSLCRIEATSAKLLLQKVLASYPQSAYFSLRSFYLERRDSERSKQNTVTKTSVSTSVLCAEDLMSNLRKSQPTLWTSLESILEELIIRFRPSYEEELLATISALLQRAESQLHHQRRMSNNDEDAIRASFMKTLGRVSEKFFRVPSGHAASSKDQKGKKTLEFTLQYKESFERDFLIPDDVHKTQLSLDDIFSKLNKWKEMLEKKVSSTPPTTPLTNVSPYLSAFSNNNPDLWPGSCDPTGSISVESKTDSAENDKGSSPSSSAKAATRAAMIASAAVAAACALEGGGGIQGYGWTSVEIPGQYAPNSCSDAKPNPELHCKLIKFDTTVEVFQRNEHLVRRIGMVGSDGIVRHFLLQFAIPYWTKADERTTQLHLLLGKCLRKESISCRRHIWIRSTPVIPIAQRLRMTAEDKSYTSLQDIFSWDCQSNLHDPSDYISAFNESLKTATVQEGSDTSQLNMKMKIDAFSKVCESVSSHLLINYVQNQYVTAELFFQFQRAFTLQTAMNCLLQYAFMVNERTPSKFIMNLRNGHVLSPDFRFSYTNQGFIDDIKPVPFRLTRNIHDFIGPFLLDGVFTTTMASASTAICKSESEIEQALQLICRDDIVSWYLSKSSQREGTQRSIQELEHQLADRVKKNVALIQSRFQHCSIKILKDDETKKYDSCDYRVKELISAATSTRNLVSMPSNYAAWL
jgi:transformation/transcription domain-associated protein